MSRSGGSSDENDRDRDLPGGLLVPHGRDLLDRLTTATWIFDIDESRVIWANQAGLKVWNADSIGDLFRRDMKADMSPAVARRLRQYQEDFANKNCVFSELWTIYPGNVSRSLRVLFSGYTLADGRIGMFCEAQDEVVQQPDSLRSADALLHTQLMISLYSVADEALYSNPAARSAVDNQGGSLKSRFVLESDYDEVMRVLRVSGEVRRVMQMRTSKGVRWHEFTARGCHDPVSGKPAFLISEADVSDLKESEARVSYIAYHDMLTGLPNRTSVPAHFAKMIGIAERERLSLGIFFLDLDQFKLINDSLGHAFGDEVLVEVSRRLQSIVGKENCVIRLGGDEFLIIVFGSDFKSYDTEAEGILQAMVAPMRICGQLMMVTPSIGISVYPADGRDAETLMKSADLAMYEAKSAGRNCVRYFSQELRDRVDNRLELESSIKLGIANREFEVFYQPRVSTRDVTIVGAEALVRWNHPQRGLVLPSLFIPICEESGLIEMLGEYVLREAMHQQKRWSDKGYPLAVSINVSQRQLSSPTFFDLVLNTLTESGCDPRMIELELTESMLMQKSDESVGTVEQLRQLGLRISVDDFGTGYSNLARLHDFSIDCVKIDRAFVKDLPGTKALAEIIVTMCKLMNVKIVAEGVETLEQLVWLRSHGCEEFQGFYFSRPIKVGKFEHMLALQSERSRHTALPEMARLRSS